MNEINVCFSSDDDNARDIGAAIASILSNANRKNDILSIYIIDGGISDANRRNFLSLKSIATCEIFFVKPNEGVFAEYDDVKADSAPPPAYLYKLKLAEILHHIDRIIYLDSYTVVNTSLADLFHTDLGICAAAGVDDFKRFTQDKNRYFIDTGIMLLDLQKIRHSGIEDKYRAIAPAHYPSTQADIQAVINTALRGSVKILDSSLGIQVLDFDVRPAYGAIPKIIRYTGGEKSCVKDPCDFFNEHYYNYLQLTPWAMPTDAFEKRGKKRGAALGEFIKHKPLAFFEFGFWKALYATYFKTKAEKYLFSFKNHNHTHWRIRLLGLKITFMKREYAKLKKQSPYYECKRRGMDITTLPPAEGQLRNIQLANLALLIELKNVCEKNDLHIWLDGGTLLGAVRHKGFIPWDDDIDVGMIRNDYDRVIDAFKESASDKNIYAAYFRSPTHPGLCIIKVLHRQCPNLFIDIFPFDLYSRRLLPEERALKTLEAKKWRKYITESFDNKIGDIETIRKILAIRDEYILEKKGSGRNDEKPDVFWGLEFPHIWKRWFYDYETFFPLKRIDFEGHSFECIANPDDYLKGLYGDYMKYPNRITSGHNMFAKLDPNEKRIIESLQASALQK